MNGLLEVPASELRPGDRVTFGDHTGWYRVRRVKHVTFSTYSAGWYRIDAWPRVFRGRFTLRPLRAVLPDETAWVRMALPGHLTLDGKLGGAKCDICHRGLWTANRSLLDKWIGEHVHRGGRR